MDLSDLIIQRLLRPFPEITFPGIETSCLHLLILLAVLVFRDSSFQQTVICILRKIIVENDHDTISNIYLLVPNKDPL